MDNTHSVPWLCRTQIDRARFADPYDAGVFCREVPGSVVMFDGICNGYGLRTLPLMTHLEARRAKLDEVCAKIKKGYYSAAVEASVQRITLLERATTSKRMARAIRKKEAQEIA